MTVDAHQRLEELAEQFTKLRTSRSRVYPKELWQRAISLTSQIPLEGICQVIGVHSAYFRKKIKDFQEPLLECSDFIEVKARNEISSELVTIDLQTPTGFMAKIQGSPSCLCQVLNSLFGEKP